MYYPYFRGKQYDLIVIRECANLMAEAGFLPIIEPVKESLNGLARSIDSVLESNGEVALIVNPEYGDLSNSPVTILEFLNTKYEHDASVFAGILLTENSDPEEIETLIERLNERRILFIHAGFNDGRRIAELSRNIDCAHAFIERHNGKLYQRHFNDSEKILIRDGFEKRANRLHPPIEFFSDLHITYEDEGGNGFGDFLIVGDEYSDSGGPAYAVAIHLTFIDDDQDNGMYIHHFKSDRFETPTDPAGKFSEALQKLTDEASRRGTKIFRSRAIDEFIDLHRRGHFPGLGYVKKLSMQHHLEVMANYFRGQ
ncbi:MULTISPECIES: sce7725 family protein [unclassified Pseudomonas]|uniref:sce7725 family protein n=1 Tax=unclassified Pseudomonas TaxID=196821 RepID=UPI002E816F55|nr:sce7725 family protein [Pseudomonas sp. AM14(2022)]